MTRIENVDIDKLKPNPYRDLTTYPWVEAKLAALMASYKEVGMFEGIIARPVGDGTFEKWFGHHRHEAARRMGMTELPIIIREASDAMMIKAMASENAEDYATDFLVQLNTWEGGIRYLTENAGHDRQNLQPLEIATLLGWSEPDERRGGGKPARLNTTAQACNAAYELITDGHLSRDDLREMSIRSARELTQAMTAQLKQLDDHAKLAGAPAASIEKGKAFIAKAGKATAERTREGKVAVAAIRADVHLNAYTEARKKAKAGEAIPQFKAFVNSLSKSVQHMLMSDTSIVKLKVIAQVLEDAKGLPPLHHKDQNAILRAQGELEELAKRSEKWAKKMTTKPEAATDDFVPPRFLLEKAS